MKEPLITQINQATIQSLIHLNDVIPEDLRDDFDVEYIQTVTPIIKELIKKYTRTRRKEDC
jgi:hypothetical protein